MSKALDRAAKVLAQAENAATPEEAAVYMARAQALAAAIDVELAVLRSHTAAKEREQPEERSCRVNGWDRKYHRKWFMELFLGIAEVNDVKCLISGGEYIAYAAGFPSDIDMCEMLFASLSIQMVKEADTNLRRGAQKDVGLWGVDGRVYRRNFYEGFVGRTKARLWEAKRAGEKSAGVEIGDESSETAVALRDKREEVEEAHEERIRVFNSSGRKVGTYRGADNSDHFVGGAQRHGRTAAERARIATEDEHDIGANQRAQIG